MSTSTAAPYPVAIVEPAGRLTQLVVDYVGVVPDSTKKTALQPRAAARSLARTAARKAAATSGSLALPPGPLGLLTLVPDLIAVWKIQSQLVADIAAVYGRSATLTKEQMVYCLFRHLASQAVRDLVVRAGERWLVQRASLALLQTVASRIGVKLSKKMIGSSLSRWLPLVGALGVGAYAYYDTNQVASTAMELFERDIELHP